MSPFERIESFSQQGHKTLTDKTTMNEDGLVMADTLFAVIDGATQRRGGPIGDKTTGAFLTEFLHKNLTHIAQDKTYHDVEAAILLAGMNRAFGEMMKANHPEYLKDGYSYGPTASISMVRFHEDGTYSFASAGDCALVEVGVHGEIFQNPQEPKPYHMEQERLEQLERLRKEQGVSYNDAWELPEVQEKYTAFKEAINVDYPAVTGDPRLEDLIFHGRRPLDDVSTLVMMTDGMFLPGVDEIQGAEMAARQMIEHGISGYTKGLNTLYDNDESREKYPRFKHRDDATALMLQLRPSFKN